MHTLTLTVIASDRVECVAILVRKQMLVIEGFDKVAADLPSAMLVVDWDIDGTSMNYCVFDYFQGRDLAYAVCGPTR